MNKVNHFLINLFHSLSQEEKKIKTKRLRSNQPSDFVLKQSETGQTSTYFSADWFQRAKRLTMSEEKKSLLFFFFLPYI